MATPPDRVAPRGATGDRDAAAAARRHAADELFLDALDQPGPQREEWLASACAGQPDLHAEALALLRAHARASVFLAGSPVPPSPAEGRVIGPYRVVRELGRGGMGVVYLAERDDGQYQRQVAIKLLRNSADADELQRRFGAERQILASLNHPNIAQLLDGGVSEGEVPYLVMEYVDGVSLTEYARRQRLGLAQRLALFLDVCAAVEHAHRNLVIHRDLKPGNILVTRTGQVKLLDFGIAKLLDPARRPHGLAETRTGFRVLTPEYASPEQVRGAALGTPSDVYALGVLLYELLCGRRPYRLQVGDHQDVMQAVTSQDPVPPSERLFDGEPGASVATLAAERGTTAERLRRQLRDDLDAIPLMALRKEPADRYASVQELAADVRRYLDGAPVVARRGSRAYRLRKFVRRHRLEVAAACVAVLSLVAGTAIALRQARVARVQRDLAHAARERTDAALGESRAVTDFLVGMFDVNYPEAGRTGVATVDELVRRGGVQAGRLSDDPALQARLLETMGRVSASVGDLPQARARFEQALRLAESSPGRADLRLTTMYHLADALRRAGQYPAADSIVMRALSLRLATPEAARPDLADLLIQAAGLRIYFGDLAGADTLSERALASRSAPGTPDSLLAAALEYRGAVLWRRGNRAAIEHYARALAMRERALGQGHHSLVTPLLRLADMHRETDPADSRAEVLLRRAIGIAREALGEQHLQHANALFALGALEQDRGNHAAAEGLFRRGTVIQEVALGRENPLVLNSHTFIARVMAQQGRAAEAEALVRSVQRRIDAQLGPGNPWEPGVLSTLGFIQMVRGHFEMAEGTYRQLLARRIRGAGDSAAVVGLTYALFGPLYVRQGRLAAAESVYLEASRRMMPGMSAAHFDVRRVHRELALVYRAMGRADAAERYEQLAGIKP